MAVSSSMAAAAAASVVYISRRQNVASSWASRRKRRRRSCCCPFFSQSRIITTTFPTKPPKYVIRCTATGNPSPETETPVEVPKGPPPLISALNVERALRGIPITDVDHYGRLGIQKSCPFDQVNTCNPCCFIYFTPLNFLLHSINHNNSLSVSLNLNLLHLYFVFT
ncbi:hypothetical protein ACSBR1_037139 [Camellia fascicularis]